MTFTEQQQKGQELLDTIIKKSWEDEAFKQELIANPKTTFEEVIGKEIDSDKTIFVEDQTNTDFVYLNIPAKPNLDELELTDEQLEQVSGGDIFVGLLVAGTVYFLGVRAGQEMR